MILSGYSDSYATVYIECSQGILTHTPTNNDMRTAPTINFTPQTLPPRLLFNGITPSPDATRAV
jgi:hypothetical protein